jgi:hypothetical protein
MAKQDGCNYKIMGPIPFIQAYDISMDLYHCQSFSAKDGVTPTRRTSSATNWRL